MKETFRIADITVLLFHSKLCGVDVSVRAERSNMG